MKLRNSVRTCALASLGLFVLIIDTKTALLGAKDGISLCLNSVIPSLFPFFVLSILINSTLSGANVAFLRPLGKLCNIPKGAESILLLGVLGGYPIGAKSISDAYRYGTLSKEDSRRMLGFCSNAGPSFIFGIVGGLFSSVTPVFLLWGIHIISAILVGVILPKSTDSSSGRSNSTAPIALPQAIESAIRAITSVCGWVVVFRIILYFCQHWFLWLLSEDLKITFIGLVELTNGCHELFSVAAPGMRFVLAATFLGFGGICVLMQTFSVTANCGIGLYFPGKIMQCTISFLLAYWTQSFVFQPMEQWRIPVYIPHILLIFLVAKVFCSHKKKKIVAIRHQMLYNIKKST